MDHQKNGKAVPTDSPIGAQPTHDRFSLVTPFVVDMSHPATDDNRRVASANEPAKTITTRNNQALCTPLVLGRDACARCRPADKPMPTLTTGGAMRGIFPMLEDGRVIDIRIRMLKPSELAAAHSFPADYILTGNRGDQVKQIGNSVPVMTAAAMCGVDFGGLAK